MARHSSPSTTNWGQIIAVGLVALLLLVAGFSAFNLLTGGRSGDPDPAAASDSAGQDSGQDASADDAKDDAAAPADGDRQCGRVTIWSEPALLPAVTAAAERAGDDCYKYSVVPRATATAQASLSRGDLPDAWIPSSSVWPAQAAAKDVPLTLGETLATTPVMLAGTPEAVAALGQVGIGADSTWPEVLTTYAGLVESGEAPVQLRVADPRIDAASMSLLGTVSKAIGGPPEPGTPTDQLMVMLAQTAVQGDATAAVASDPTTLVPVTEAQVADAADRGLSLQGLPLASGVIDIPFVRGREAVSADAVDALEQQLTSAEGAADLTALGLRPGTDGPSPELTGVPGNLGVDGEPLDPQALAALGERWSVIAPQSRILTLIDISGSMEAEVGESTRIDLTREAAQTALSVVPDQTEIGLWYFSTSLDDDKDYRSVLPLRPLDEEVRGVTQRDLLLSETASLSLDILEGDTGLHDSLWAAYKYMVDNQEEGTISSVLLLTDGINDDSTGGLSESEVIDRLTEAREGSATPVTVVLIGVGGDVDASALDRLAKAAGGEALVIEDPRQLPQVFVDVVASRAS